MEKHVAMDNLCRTTRKSLAHPYSSKATRDPVSLEPFVESFSNLGEARRIASNPLGASLVLLQKKSPGGWVPRLKVIN